MLGDGGNVITLTILRANKIGKQKQALEDGYQASNQTQRNCDGTPPLIQKCIDAAKVNATSKPRL